MVVMVIMMVIMMVVMVMMAMVVSMVMVLGTNDIYIAGVDAIFFQMTDLDLIAGKVHLGQFLPKDLLPGSQVQE